MQLYNYLDKKDYKYIYRIFPLAKKIETKYEQTTLLTSIVLTIL